VLSAKAQLNVERSEIITAYQNEQISASQARSKLAEINRRSILSPELKRFMGDAAGGDGTGGSEWAPVPGVPNTTIRRVR
jgi:hypothetical protein